MYIIIEALCIPKIPSPKADIPHIPNPKTYNQNHPIAIPISQMVQIPKPLSQIIQIQIKLGFCNLLPETISLMKYEPKKKGGQAA